jgi:hypothetical protein
MVPGLFCCCCCPPFSTFPPVLLLLLALESTFIRGDGIPIPIGLIPFIFIMGIPICIGTAIPPPPIAMYPIGVATGIMGTIIIGCCPAMS